jgi:hypothetical protein
MDNEKNKPKIRIITSAYDIGEASFTNEYLPHFNSVDIEVSEEQYKLLKGNNNWMVTIRGVELLEG